MSIAADGLAAPADVAVVWFRRDLRVHDHPALVHGIRTGRSIAPLFVLDPTLLPGASPRRTDSGSCWGLRALADALESRGSRLTVRVGRPTDVVPAFAVEVGAGEVLVSRDYTPFGRARDRDVAARLEALGIAFRAGRGLLIQEPEDVLTANAGPTRGSRRSIAAGPPWRSARSNPARRSSRRHPPSWQRGTRATVVPTAEDLGLPGPTADPAAMPPPGEPAARARLDAWLDQGPGAGVAAYAETRDRLDDPDGTSHLGADLRFGLLSPVEVATRALAVGAGSAGPERFVSELAWRDFYAHALWHEPRLAREPHAGRHVGVEWPGTTGLDAWRAGRTGYPVVDAPMRQLVATGWMPNRARMIVASFLAKDLLVDWRIGEACFMTHLVDGDPASNLGGWQWSASVGVDAPPSFRVFNPVTQGERFDPAGTTSGAGFRSSPVSRTPGSTPRGRCRPTNRRRRAAGSASTTRLRSWITRKRVPGRSPGSRACATHALTNPRARVYAPCTPTGTTRSGSNSARDACSVSHPPGPRDRPVAHR